MSMPIEFRRFTESDYYGYAGVEQLPSGNPWICSTKLPCPEGWDGPVLEVEVIVSGSEQGAIVVGVHGQAEQDLVVAKKHIEANESWSLYWELPSEEEAAAFATLIAQKKLSLLALEALGGTVL